MHARFASLRDLPLASIASQGNDHLPTETAFAFELTYPSQRCESIHH